jgi:hypothetical protein
MKKIAIAMALCVSASFSPSLAQTLNREATVTVVGAFSEVITTRNTLIKYTANGREMSVKQSGQVTLNGTDITSDPAIGPKLAGATCKIIPGLTTCTK